MKKKIIIKEKNRTVIIPWHDCMVTFVGRVDWTARFLCKKPENIVIPKGDFQGLYAQAGAILKRLKEKRIKNGQQLVSI